MSLVSIILPYFDKKKYFKETIDSILDQTFQNFEIIVVDDEISIESKTFLNEIKKIDSRIIILENLKNLGAGYSRNHAIKFSKGKFLAFCDCDDLWDKNKLNNQLKFMKKFKIDACHTSYEVINDIGKIISMKKAKNKLNFNNLLNSCDIGLSTVIIKKKLLDNFEACFPNLKTKEDYILWLKLAKKGVVFFGFDEKLTKWRKLKNSLSSNTLQKIFDGYKVYNVFLNYGFIKSFFKLIILSVNSILKR